MRKFSLIIALRKNFYSLLDNPLWISISGPTGKATPFGNQAVNGDLEWINTPGLTLRICGKGCSY